MKKLNVGSGTDYKKGWVNLDVDKSLKADVYTDIKRGLPFSNNSFDFILLQDVLEHLTKEDGEVFLSEVHRVLRPNGRVKIRIPNVFQIFEQFEREPEVMMLFLYGNTKKSGEFGAHKVGYTPELMIQRLTLSGFKNIKVSEKTTNFIILAKKGNLIKVKPRIMLSGLDSGGLGGAEIFLSNLAKEFTSKKINVELTVISGSKFQSFLQKNKLKSITFPVRMDVFGNLKGLVKTFLFLPIHTFLAAKYLFNFRSRGGNVIILPGITDKVIFTPLAKLLHITVIWIEFAPIGPVFSRNFGIPKLLYMGVRRLPDKVIVPTENTRKSALGLSRIPELSITKIPCGVITMNSHEITKAQKRGRKKYKAIFEQNSFLIGNISRLEIGKGQDLLITAFEKLTKKHKNLRLIIIGTGAEEKRLKRLVKKLKLTSKVIFTGYVKDSAGLVANLDCFVFPSTWDLEGFGLVTAEAMSLGVPVVVTNSGPNPEVVGDAGVISEPDAGSLAKALEKIIKSKSLRAKLGKMGKARVKNFAMEKVADEYLGEIENLLLIANNK